MKINKFFSVIITVIFLATITLNVSAATQAYNWYCVHRNDHLQPSLDTSLAFIEQHDGYYIDKRHGDSCDSKKIYLTFDAGYENGNIERTLDILKEENVTAAFFVLGNLIERNTDLVNRMFNEGHLVCNHTFSHRSMTGKKYNEFKDELNKLENICYEKTGKHISKYYRPPEGKFDEVSLKYAQMLGYKTIFWSFAYADWDNNKQMSADKAMNKIMNNIHNGEILLLHPTSQTNVEILSDVIKNLKSQGYSFGTLDELCVK